MKKKPSPYFEAEPKQFGNLHERMKYLIECGQKCGLWKFDNDTWQAVWDLATEVAGHYARRTAPQSTSR